MAIQTALTITEDQKRKYRDDGFFILEGVIPDDDLAMIRETCDRLVKEQEAEMDRQSVDQITLSKRDKRYFVFLAFKEHPELGEWLFSDWPRPERLGLNMKYSCALKGFSPSSGTIRRLDPSGRTSQLC